jgi:hypothetical protein
MAIPLYQSLTRNSHSPEIKQKNEATFSSGGELVGKLPDGRFISRYEIESATSHNHWVYVISDNSSVSVNYPIRVGKLTHNEAMVIINGKEYVERNN